MEYQLVLQSPAHWIQSTKLRRPKWGAQFDDERWLVRENAIRALGETLDFVLLEKPTEKERPVLRPEEDLKFEDGSYIVGTCRFGRRKGVLHGKVYSGWVIGQVLVIPSRRGFGVGKILKQHMARWMKEQEGADFGFLYSSVNDFYEPEFTMCPFHRMTFSPTATLASNIKLIKSLTTEEGREQIQTFAKADCDEVMQTQSDEFLLLPEFVRYEFHLAHETAAAEVMKREPLVAQGAFIESDSGCTEIGQQSFIMWHGDFCDDQLIITRIRDHGNSKDRNTLIAAARYMAHLAGVQRVAYFDDNVEDVDLTDATVLPADISIPSATFYHEALREGGVKWASSQRHSWS